MDHNTQTSTWVPPPPVTTMAVLPQGQEEKRIDEERACYEDHDRGMTPGFRQPASDKKNSLPSKHETTQDRSAPSTSESTPSSGGKLPKDQSDSHSLANNAGSTAFPLAVREAAAKEFCNAYPLPETCDKKSLPQGSPRSPRNAAWLEDQKLDVFTYTPLANPSRFIRLLFVEQANFGGDILKCRLEIVPVEDLREYVALSYVWGEPIFDTAMICNDQRFNIPPSLSAALRQYRITRRCVEDTPIWADAVCINQADKTEVTGQISLMNWIYSQASEVFAYLGEAPAGWTPTYELIYVLAHAYDHILQPGITKDLLSGSDDPQHNVQRNTEKEFRQAYSLPGRDALAWERFVQFSSRPWFVRTWIIQEVALARSVNLFYGRYPIPWKTFSTAYQFYTMLNMQFGQPHVTQQDPLGAWNSLGVGRLRNLCEVARSPVENWDTLIYFLTQTVAEFVASNPRDKVIGILGLLGEGLTWHRTAVLAHPDNTVDQVYHYTAVHLVDLGAAHVMLRFAGLSRQKETKQIPSWAPDWSAQTTDFGTPATIRRFDNNFCAASHLKSQIYLEGRREAGNQHSLSLPLPTKFIVSGAVIDTIRFVSRSNSSNKSFFSSTSSATSKSDGEHKSEPTSNNPEYSHSYTTFKNWYSSARSCLEQAWNSIASMPYDDVEEAFARTLIFNNLRDAKRHSGFFTPVHDVVKSHHELIATLKADQNFYFHLEKYSAMETYFMQALACYQTRSFVVTTKGYMAMVPETSVEGDTVALFCGSPTLVILRDVTEGERIEARLVGEAYVHGLMEGQLKDRQHCLHIREIALV
jgi:hypothetical protein